VSASFDPLCKEVEQMEKELEDEIAEKRAVIDQLSAIASKAYEHRYVLSSKLLP